MIGAVPPRSRVPQQANDGAPLISTSTAAVNALHNRPQYAGGPCDCPGRSYADAILAAKL